MKEDLATARAELVERLYGLVRSSTPELRGSLLAVKRDAFNGRPLARHRGDPRWSELADLAGPPAERVAALEERLEEWREGFAAAYRRRRAREHWALFATLDDAGFRRGLALASPALSQAAGRARRDAPDLTWGRRESRLDLGLLRYVSRAALKLSPFSTLTRMALGTVAGEAPEPFAWTGGGWSERSLLRVRRYLVEQDLALLCRYRPFREGLGVALNPTLEETAPERYRFLRPERWTPGEEGDRLRSAPAALAEMKLTGTLVIRILGALAGAPRAYRELADAMASELGDADSSAVVETTLDALIDAGVLLLETRWPGNEPHLEKRLLAHLRGLPAEAGLSAVTAALELLVALEEGFAQAAEPDRSVEEIDRALDSLWQAEAPLAGIAPEVERYRARPGDVCEDVLLVPAPGARDVFRLSRPALREIVRSAAPWARLIAFQTHRFDLLHTLAAFLGRRWPGRREVGFLELFAAAQPLWREYRKLCGGGSPEAWRSAFNPLDLPEVAALALLRAESWAALRELLRALPPGQDLAAEALAELAARIPERYAEPVGACLFVQPADAAGRVWVLNRVFEGTGRYGSRFTAVMDTAVRGHYTGRYARAAAREVAGEPAELLDLMWSQGDTLNVHAAQTPRMLAIPGETPDRAGAEPLSPRDLRVSLDGYGGLPRLSDAAGRRLLPVHLGGAVCSMMPFLIQFLALWGVGEIRPPRPPVPARRRGAVLVAERLTAGCVVLARRRWTVALGEALRRELATACAEDAFAAVHRWRAGHDLPERLFWIETTHYRGVGDVYKPQYLDFTSPLFMEIFRSGLQGNGDPLTFEEMLPELEALPRAPGGEHWAVELHLDTLPWGPDDLAAEPAGVPGFSTVTTSLAAGGRSV